MKTLALNTTSARKFEFALKSDGTLLSQSVVFESTGKSSVMMEHLKISFELIGLNPSDVELVSVVKGPGSFAGVRVGVAIAKTFAQVSGAKVIGMSLQEVVAFSIRNLDGIKSVIMDAKRGEVFVAVVEGERVVGEFLDSPEELPEWLDRFGKISVGVVVDNATKILSDKILKKFHSIVNIETLNFINSALELGVKIYREKGGDNPDEILPIYFRKSDAEISLKKSREK